MPRYTSAGVLKCARAALHKSVFATLIHTWLQPGDDLIASDWKPFKRFPADFAMQAPG